MMNHISEIVDGGQSNCCSVLGQSLRLRLGRWRPVFSLRGVQLEGGEGGVAQRGRRGCVLHPPHSIPTQVR